MGEGEISRSNAVSGPQLDMLSSAQIAGAQRED